MPIQTVAATRNPTTATGTPDYLQGLEQYAAPNVNLGSTSASSMVGEPLQATIANQPALARVAEIVNQINQQQWLGAPGRQAALGAIQGRIAGQLSPETVSEAANAAAQTYGGGGFGVDSPAWQSAIRRALGLQREELVSKGLGELEQLYSGMPTTDVQKYTLTPSDYAQAQDAARARQLQLAGLQQQGGLEAAKLAQARAFQEQNLELSRATQELARKKQEAELYSKYGIGVGPRVAEKIGYYDIQGRWHEGAPASSIGGF